METPIKREIVDSLVAELGIEDFAKATIREEINYHGVSVIIPRRECMQTLQRHLKQKKAAAKNV